MFEFLVQLLHELMFLTGYIGGGNAFPKQLSSEEERKYLYLYAKGDMNARNILIEHNLRLVAHITKKYSNESNADDLISVGIIGLIKNGHKIKIDINKRTIDLLVDEKQLEERRKSFVPVKKDIPAGFLTKYAKTVQGANVGAITG